MKSHFLPFRMFFILFFVVILKVQGQQQPVFTIDPNHPGGRWEAIMGITQGNEGFLWLATHAGLHSYDGYSYDSYFHDPDNSNSIASNKTEAIIVSQSGFIWIGTEGLDRFDPVTKSFTHFTHDPNDPRSLSHNQVNTIMEDSRGVIWVGTAKGLNRYDAESDSFTRYQHDPQNSTSISDDHVAVLSEDRKGNIWAGTEKGGLNLFDKNMGTFIHYVHHPEDMQSLTDNNVRSILEDSQGNFWVGTIGGGIHTMNREKGTFMRHLHDPLQPDKLSAPPNSGPVVFIHEDVNGAIWIGAQSTGVSRYDPNTKKIKHFSESSDNSIGLDSDGLSCVFSSREGILWMGTAYSGKYSGRLHRTDPSRSSFAYQYTEGAVWGIVEDPQGKLWAATQKGLKVYNVTKEPIQEIKVKDSLPSSLETGWLISILMDRRGMIWIGDWIGLHRYNPKTGKFTLFTHDPRVKTSIGKGAVVALHEDRDGVLWVGTLEGGLCRMDTVKETFTRFQHDPNNANSLSNDFVSAIYEDPQGTLWVGTWGGAGLNRVDRKTGNIKRYLGGNGITEIRGNPSDRLWVGTMQAGLFLYDQQKDVFSRYTDKETGKQIFSNVMDMEYDDLGNLWVVSVGGLAKLDKNGSLNVMYGSEMGMNTEDFHILATHKGRKGQLYIGNNNGFFTVLPQENMPNANPPQIVFTEFRLLDEPLLPEGERSYFNPLRLAEGIELAHNQNVFSLSFSGIHFTNPALNRHMYKLENYDENWREVKSELTASYIKVPPGDYIFRVKAASSEGVWAEKILTITIHPPWWATWWAYGIYAVLLGGIIFTADRTQRRRIIHREQELAREKELAHAKEIEKAYGELGKAHQTLKSTQAQLIQSEKMASLGELTAGIAHEIQNPLNFVNNFSEVSAELVDEIEEERAKKREARDETLVSEILRDVKENLEKINHHGKRADAIVKGMLEHSRTSSGEKVLTDINALADEYLRLSYHGMRAKDKSFNADFRTDFDPNLAKINVVPQDIGRVLLNIINNAFQATHELSKGLKPLESFKPRVTVTTKQREGSPLGAGGSERQWVQISISDNGPGIPDAIKDKIFQPFFTTKPTGQGTGLGLSLSYDIVKAHGGELSVRTPLEKVNSNEGEGAEFIFALPLNRV
ncbi:two-component regulator propeller domain-containing protein [Aquiflexum sp.]|uniref:two-component regulator propeller domain-containing protein n=1 Tax=Aquiflexum sp. TaxID=1872584 RepID=UPI0035936FED